jgi:hypothetical protein
MRHKVRGSSAIAVTAAVIASLLASGGCSPAKYSVRYVMVPVLDNARDAAFASNDIQTFRDGAPANLFLLEGFIRTDPKVREMRLTAAQLYFSYAFAFIEEPDPEYASLLYRKGLDHGYAALALNKKLPRSPDAPFREFEAALPELREKDVPAAVWTAVNWAQYISLHLDSTSILADIPKVTALLDQAALLDPEYFEGLPYVMIGALHSFKPPIMGGDPEASAASFEKAFAVSGGSFLLSRYLYARYYAYRIQDSELFEETLSGVMTAEMSSDDPYLLLNMIAQEKSHTLLDEVDELF